MLKFAMVGMGLLLVVAPVFGDGVAAGVKAGTLGAGVELSFGMTDTSILRIGAQGGSFEPQIEETDIEYDGSVDLRSANLLLDLHPRGGAFHFTIGAVYNDSEVTARSTEDTVMMVNDVPYPVSEVGTLVVDITFDELAPYVGIGWGHPFRRGGSWTLKLDIGAAYAGAADVELRAVPHDPTLVLPEDFLDDLQTEEDASRKSSAITKFTLSCRWEFCTGSDRRRF
ncbi:MAG: hypothetical protein KY432_05610 [Acidobacteria bacterium]|nr:hypothetical protein [Acidobacteriota bacterium]